MGTGNGVQLMSDSVPTTMFSCPGAAGFRVRGPTYLQDKKKVTSLSEFSRRLSCFTPSCRVQHAASSQLAYSSLLLA